jgi:hypothetical protein
MALEFSALFELLKAIPGIVTILGDRLQAAKDKPWERILISLDTLEKLTNLHVKAIGVVTSPILETGDMLSTCQSYQQLVNNPDFPIGYGTVRGELETALGFEQFRKAEVQDKLKTVLDELKDFQYAAFMLGYDCYRMADALESAKELWSLLSAHDQHEPDSRAKGLQTRFYDDFKGVFQWLTAEREKQFQIDVPELLTPDDVMNIVRIWSREWQRDVQKTLYGGRGLNYAIGQLRMEHYNK